MKCVPTAQIDLGFDDNIPKDKKLPIGIGMGLPGMFQTSMLANWNNNCQLLSDRASSDRNSSNNEENKSKNDKKKSKNRIPMQGSLLFDQKRNSH